MTVGLRAVITATDKATPVIRGVQAATVGLNDQVLKGLGKLDQVSSKIGAGIKTTIATLGVAGLAVGGIGKNVIDAGADFEQAITNVGAVSLMTRKEVEPLEKLALELGATTQFSATQVAGAMELMGKAGFDNAQIMSGVGGLLAAAAADGAELEETAGNISNVLKGMGLEATETARVADVLTLASARTNTAISSLGVSMANVSSTARQLGVPLEDTVAMVALLQDVGLDASEAGSAVSTMLTMMSSPSKEVAAQMAAMGVKFDDAAGNMLKPAEVLEQLVKAGKKAGGNMRQVAFFADLVGLRGQKAAVNLKELFASGKVTSLTNELEGAAGSAGKMAGIRMDTFRGDIETLGGSIDSLKISLFDMQSGPLREVVQDMTRWVDVNKSVITSGFAETIKEWTPIVKGFGDGVAVSFQKVEPVVKGIGNVLDTFFGEKVEGAQAQAYFLGRNITDAGLAFVGFTAATKVATFATWTFQGATKAAKIVVLAWEGGIRLAKWALVSYELWTKAGTIGTLALSSASVIATGSLVAQRTATMAASIGFMGLAKAAGVAAVAVAAYMLVSDQNDKLKQETGGKGILDVGWEWATTDKGLKEIADENLDAKAKADAAARNRDQRAGLTSDAMLNLGDPGALPPGLGPDGGVPGLGSAEDLNRQLGLLYARPPMPGVAPAPAAAPAVPQQPGMTPADIKAAVKQSLEITVKAPKDTAEVTKRPSGAKVDLKPSGAD